MTAIPRGILIRTYGADDGEVHFEILLGTEAVKIVLVDMRNLRDECNRVLAIAADHIKTRNSAKVLDYPADK